jgi:hypothetical protein
VFSYYLLDINYNITYILFMTKVKAQEKEKLKLTKTKDKKTMKRESKTQPAKKHVFKMVDLHLNQTQQNHNTTKSQHNLLHTNKLPYIPLPLEVQRIVPIFNYQLVAWQLSLPQARFAYPKFRDEVVNFNEDERSQIPELNTSLPFNEIIKDPNFIIVTNSRLNNIKVYEAQLISSSCNIKDINTDRNKLYYKALNHLHLDTEKLILNVRKDFGDESISGMKCHVDYYNDVVYTLADPSSFSSYQLRSINDQSYSYIQNQSSNTCFDIQKAYSIN